MTATATRLMSVSRGGEVIAHEIDDWTLEYLVERGRVRHDDAVWRDGTTIPQRVDSLGSLFSTRSYAVALLLSILITAVGVDRFYLGHVASGIAKLAMFVLFLMALTTGLVLNPVSAVASLDVVAFATAGTLHLVAVVLGMGIVTWQFVDVLLVASRRLGDGSLRRLT